MFMVTLDDIKDKIKGMKCKLCDTNFDNDEIEMYAHPSGWKIDGLEERQWLYIRCKKCDYDNALFKRDLMNND